MDAHAKKTVSLKPGDIGIARGADDIGKKIVEDMGNRSRSDGFVRNLPVSDLYHLLNAEEPIFFDPFGNGLTAETQDSLQFGGMSLQNPADFAVALFGPECQHLMILDVDDAISAADFTTNAAGYHSFPRCRI
jgi:hypothetical protein